jgi:hypothetical protein
MTGLFTLADIRFLRVGCQGEDRFRLRCSLHDVPLGCSDSIAGPREGASSPGQAYDFGRTDPGLSVARQRGRSHHPLLTASGGGQTGSALPLAGAHESENEVPSK